MTRSSITGGRRVDGGEVDGRKVNTFKAGLGFAVLNLHSVEDTSEVSLDDIGWLRRCGLDTRMM